MKRCTWYFIVCSSSYNYRSRQQLPRHLATVPQYTRFSGGGNLARCWGSDDNLPSTCVVVILQKLCSLTPFAVWGSSTKWDMSTQKCVGPPSPDQSKSNQAHRTCLTVNYSRGYRALLRAHCSSLCERLTSFRWGSGFPVGPKKVAMSLTVYAAFSLPDAVPKLKKKQTNSFFQFFVRFRFQNEKEQTRDTLRILVRAKVLTTF